MLLTIALICIALLLIIFFASIKRLNSYQGKAETLTQYVIDHKKSGDYNFQNAVRAAMEKYSKTYKWAPGAFGIAYKSVQTEYAEDLKSGDISVVVYDILITELILREGPQKLHDMGEGIKSEISKIKQAADAAYDKIYLKKTLGV
jgi:hypothetical protein